MITEYKINKGLIDIYNKIASNTSFTFAIDKLPMIRKTDYDVGYIERYFLRQQNNPVARIMEVDKKQWIKFNPDPFYLKVSLRWKIAGRIDVVSSSNLKSLTEANKELPGLLEKIENDLNAGDVCVTLGAGNIYKVGTNLIDKLSKEN